MPIHNWKKAPPGLFHHFHQQWTGELCNALNGGILPADFFALIEQKTVGVEPDLMTLGIPASPSEPSGTPGGIAIAESPPQVHYRTQAADRASYARRANRVTVRNTDGDLVAVIELVSPGNKHDKYAIGKFVEKAVDFLERGVNLLVIDLFPPSRRDPQGIHKAIWDEIDSKRFKLPARKPLTLAAYIGAPAFEAYVQPVAVGEKIPDMPVFLYPGRYVNAPLESTYAQTWEKCPAAMKARIERPARPT